MGRGLPGRGNALILGFVCGEVNAGQLPAANPYVGSWPRPTTPKLCRCEASDEMFAVYLFENKLEIGTCVLFGEKEGEL